MERSIGRPGPFLPPRFGRICPPAHSQSLGSVALHAVFAIGRVAPVAEEKRLGNIARSPWPHFLERTFPLSFPGNATTIRESTREWGGKGMGTDRRLNSFAQHSFAQIVRARVNSSG